MNFDDYIQLILTEIKYGIDNFNRVHGATVRAEYPANVEIEYSGVKITVPFSPPIAVSGIEVGETNE